MAEVLSSEHGGDERERRRGTGSLGPGVHVQTEEVAPDMPFAKSTTHQHSPSCWASSPMARAGKKLLVLCAGHLKPCAGSYYLELGTLRKRTHFLTYGQEQDHLCPEALG